jgi:hypothetical protein
MTVFVNLFQNLGSGYMKVLPEFQIESISKPLSKFVIKIYSTSLIEIVYGNFWLRHVT